MLMLIKEIYYITASVVVTVVFGPVISFYGDFISSRDAQAKRRIAA